MSKKHKAEKEKHGKTKLSSGKKSKTAPLAGEETVPAIEAARTTKQTPESEAADKPGKGLAARQVTLISKALADPTRMAVLRAIAKGGATCSGMRDGAGVSAATLSHHMKELESAGLIETERKGRFVEPKFHRKIWKKYLEELGSFAK